MHRESYASQLLKESLLRRFFLICARFLWIAAHRVKHMPMRNRMPEFTNTQLCRQF